MIKSLVNNNLYIPYDSNYQQSSNLYLRAGSLRKENTRGVNKNYPYITSGLSSVTNYSPANLAQGNTSITLVIRIDNYQEVTDVIQYRLIDCLASVGGLSSIVLRFCILITSYFTRKSFTSKIVQKLYTKQQT